DDWVSAAAVKGIHRDESMPSHAHHPSGDLAHWGKMFAEQPSCPAPIRWGNGWHDRISMFFHLLSWALRVLPFPPLTPLAISFASARGSAARGPDLLNRREDVLAGHCETRNSQ